ncbi:MAG: M28 family peptidase [Candidatus Krumholzibacteriia bacterium]
MKGSRGSWRLWRGVLAAGACCAGVVGGCSRGIEPPPEPDGMRAFGYLEEQVAFGPRVPGSAAAERCRHYLLEELRRHTRHVETQEFEIADPYGADSLQLVNLIARFRPEHRHRVLLAAHYDSRPRADQDSGAARERPVPGANDGASGVAVLLEVARALEAWDPGIGVDVVFFDGEDYGREGDPEHYLLGSKHYARTIPAAGSDPSGFYRPRAVVLLDMVGDRDLRIPMEGYSLRTSPALTRLVFAVAESLQAPGFAAEPGPPVYDDHVPFLERGIPAVDLIDFDYPAWHTERDVPERCSPQSLESVARVVLHTLMRLSLRYAS